MKKVGKKFLLMAGAGDFDGLVMRLTLTSLPPGQTWPGYLAAEIRWQLCKAVGKKLAVMVMHTLGFPERSKSILTDLGHLALVGWLAVRCRYHDGSIGN